MHRLIIPESYQSLLDVRQTEKAIKLIKDFFQQQLATELNLYRVTAPLFLSKGTGINDALNGVEKPVTFAIRDLTNTEAEIVQSLAKWKRLALADYDIPCGYGIYTDMNAIRPDEVLDNIHSLYVDQWDWEMVIREEDRQRTFLHKIVRKIYAALRRLDFFIHEHYAAFMPMLPEEITFIHAEEALTRYPDLTPREREDKLAEEYKAIFIEGIGHPLRNGERHDGRAPDYDDWSTEIETEAETKTKVGYRGLNGDIVLWNPILRRAFEVSSMGIRVDKKALLYQLAATQNEHLKDLYFHQRLLNDELPLSIGGGIGQSRLCMLFLRKAHIGEVQANIWSDDVRRECRARGIALL